MLDLIIDAHMVNEVGGFRFICSRRSELGFDVGIVVVWPYVGCKTLRGGGRAGLGSLRPGRGGDRAG
jgi:hypothetical protein